MRPRKPARRLRTASDLSPLSAGEWTCSGTTSPASLLYLSYDGMTDPLGRSQVLPYLIGLAARGHRIDLISLDKPNLLARNGRTVKALCDAAGIRWHSIPYRWSPAFIAGRRNVRALTLTGAALQQERNHDLVHCRSDLAGIAGLALQRRFGLKLLYDMRALWPDERAEGGAWDQSKFIYRALFRHFKRLQHELVARSDAVVTLSNRGRDMLPSLGLNNNTLVDVIPCCADFDHFTLPNPAGRAARRFELAVGSAPLLIHLGTIGCNVMLDEMLDFFAAYRRRRADARLLFLTPAGDVKICAAAAARGLSDAVEIRSATREEVPDWIGAADLGLFFVRPVPSKRAASPTKLGEMLACGLPVITNDGIGDMSEIIAEIGAGVVIDRFDPTAYDQAIDRLDNSRFDPAAIRQQARKWFDIVGGIDRYDLLYRRLANADFSQE